MIKAYLVVDNTDHKTAATTDGNVVGFILQIFKCDLKTIAAWAWVVVYLLRLVELHVFNLDLVVDSNFLVG